MNSSLKDWDASALYKQTCLDNLKSLTRLENSNIEIKFERNKKDGYKQSSPIPHFYSWHKQGSRAE